MTKKTDIKTPELWQFPMDYPISIIGHEGQKQTLISEVSLILAEIFPQFDLAALQLRPSKTGKYHALKATLYVSCADEINRLYAALDKASSVKTVL